MSVGVTERDIALERRHLLVARHVAVVLRHHDRQRRVRLVRPGRVARDDLEVVRRLVERRREDEAARTDRRLADGDLARDGRGRVAPQQPDGRLVHAFAGPADAIADRDLQVAVVRRRVDRDARNRRARARARHRVADRREAAAAVAAGEVRRDADRAAAAAAAQAVLSGRRRRVRLDCDVAAAALAAAAEAARARRGRIGQRALRARATATAAAVDDGRTGDGGREAVAARAAGRRRVVGGRAADLSGARAAAARVAARVLHAAHEVRVVAAVARRVVAARVAARRLRDDLLALPEHRRAARGRRRADRRRGDATRADLDRVFRARLDLDRVKRRHRTARAAAAVRMAARAAAAHEQQLDRAHALRRNERQVLRVSVIDVHVVVADERHLAALSGRARADGRERPLDDVGRIRPREVAHRADLVRIRRHRTEPRHGAGERRTRRHAHRQRRPLRRLLVARRPDLRLDLGRRRLAAQRRERTAELRERRAKVDERQRADRLRLLGEGHDLAARDEARRLVQVLGLDPRRGRRALTDADLVHVAVERAVARARHAAEGDAPALAHHGLLVVPEAARRGLDAVIVGAERRAVPDHVHLVPDFLVDRLRVGRALAVRRAAAVDAHGARRAVGRRVELDAPARILVVVLRRAEERIVGSGRRAERKPRREREGRHHVVQRRLLRLVQLDQDLSVRAGVAALRRDAARRADHAVRLGERVRVRRAVQRVDGRIRNRLHAIAALAQVPDADVGRPHRIRLEDAARLGAAVPHREFDVLRKHRNLHPDERLALRIPRVDLVREDLALRVNEDEVAAVGRVEVGVAEARGLALAQAHQHREVFKRLALGVARDGHLDATRILRDRRVGTPEVDARRERAGHAVRDGLVADHQPGVRHRHALLEVGDRRRRLLAGRRAAPDELERREVVEVRAMRERDVDARGPVADVDDRRDLLHGLRTVHELVRDLGDAERLRLERTQQRARHRLRRVVHRAEDIVVGRAGREVREVRHDRPFRRHVGRDDLAVAEIRSVRTIGERDRRLRRALADQTQGRPHLRRLERRRRLGPR